MLAPAGDYELAMAWLETARAREPGAAQRYHCQRGYLPRLMGRYEEAVREYRDAAPLGLYPRLSLAISYVQVEKALEENPDFTPALWGRGSAYSDPAILTSELADLEKAGLPWPAVRPRSLPS
jgi:hypothetical protein